MDVYDFDNNEKRKKERCTHFRNIFLKNNFKMC